VGLPPVLPSSAADVLPVARLPLLQVAAVAVAEVLRARLVGLAGRPPALRTHVDMP
jgi:hypothetical protein